MRYTKKDEIDTRFTQLILKFYEWKLMTVDPQRRSTWRSGVRSDIYAASQLPGRGPTDVDDAPAKIPIMMMMIKVLHYKQFFSLTSVS